MSLARSLMLLVTSVVLNACGQKGSLVLPSSPGAAAASTPAR